MKKNQDVVQSFIKIEKEFYVPLVATDKFETGFQGSLTITMH